MRFVRENYKTLPKTLSYLLSSFSSTENLEILKPFVRTAKEAYYYCMQTRNYDPEFEDLICKDNVYAHAFAKHIKGANIKKCQEAILNSPEHAYFFAREIEGADVEKCQEVACKDPYYAYYFARDVKGADINKCREVCIGTHHYDDFDKLTPEFLEIVRERLKIMLDRNRRIEEKRMFRGFRRRIDL
jgi:hypothetical protein